jgi:P-type Cu2+ transporter
MDATLTLPRVASAASAARLADGEAAVVDDAQIQQAFTTWETAPDRRRLGRSQLRLAGLSCAGCAGAVERALRADPGVVDASASYGTQRASVLWDPERTRFSDLLAAVRRAGYDAAPDAAAPARALRRAEERKALWRFFVAAFCMMQVMMYQAPLYLAEPGTMSADLRTLLLWAAWLLSIPVLLFSAAPMFRDAWEGLRQRRIGMDLPVSIGIALTFVVSTGATFAPGAMFGTEPLFDSLTMFVSFLLAGRWLALRMRNRVAASLEGALSRLPSAVRIVADDGTTTLVAMHRVKTGDRVQVLAGEAFPADGRLLEGETEVDEALLTGESRPVRRNRGDEAIAGSINLSAPVVQRVERIGADTRYEGIVRLMRTAMTDRPPVLRAADRVAGPFLWGVLVLAALAAAVWSFIDPARAVWVAVSVLIVTCPCALSLAAPSALLAAAGALVRRGVLVQRFDALESLAAIDTICFDKTGTLTQSGRESLTIELQPPARAAGLDEPKVRALAAVLAALSTHPLARSIAASSSAPASLRFHRVREYPGLGVAGVGSDGAEYRLGAVAWATRGAGCSLSADGPETWLSGPDGPLARFSFTEVLRDDAGATIAALRGCGLDVRLLSGDASARVADVARRLGVAQTKGDATPADKLAAIVALQAAGHRVAMVGDGLNDAPVMARADASFAIGDGSAQTRSHADFILLSGALADVAQARLTARRAMRIVRQNLAWAVAYNATCVPLALLGLFPPWAAGLGMATSSLFVVVNALRVDRWPTLRPGTHGDSP